MIQDRALRPRELHGFPGLSMKARDAVLARQPKTVLEALRIPGVGRSTTRKLLDLGVLTDADGVQERVQTLEDMGLR